MARRTRAAVSAVTLSEPLMVRETVAVETLASRATSLMFIGNPKLYGVSLKNRENSTHAAREQRKWNGFAHGAVSGWRGVQMVATVVGRTQTVGPAWVAHGLIDVKHRVKASGGADPCVDGLPVGFVGRIGMVVVGAHVERDGCADYADSMGMGSENHLLIRAFD